METTSAKINLLLADDHQIILDGLISILEDAEDMTVVATALDGTEVLKALESTAVDVLVLDLRMPRLNGIDTLRELARRFPNVRTVVLSMSLEVADIKNAMQAGAKGYVLKNKGAKDLVAAIREVAAGKVFFTNEVSQVMMVSMSQEGHSKDIEVDGPKLTPKEMEVLAYILGGMIAKEIADAMNISKHTVDSHKKNIMQKTGLHKDTQLAVYAKDLGIEPMSKQKPSR
jgi:two-component system nitrate/nitrite response regulator NarL